MGARSRRGRIRPSSRLEHEEELNEDNRRRDRDRVARRPLESGRQGLGRGVDGYLGTESVTEGRTLAAQIGTAVYFLFFFLMPWYSKIDKCLPEPERVTSK